MSGNNSTSGDSTSGGCGGSEWVPALAATTAIFCTTTFLLAVALIIVHLRYSRRKGRNKRSEKNGKVNPAYWVSQDEESVQQTGVTTSTPNLSVWYSPPLNPTTFAPQQQTTTTGKQNGALVASVSMAPVASQSRPPVPVKRSHSQGKLTSPPYKRDIRPKRVAPPPPRSKKGKVGFFLSKDKHKSQDNDYDWPDIARDYQNVEKSFKGTGSLPTHYKELNVHTLDNPSDYDTPSTKPT